MKRVAAMVLAFVICLVGCGKQPARIVQTIEGNMKTYYEMSDGTWQCGDYIYQHRLEIRGRLSGAVADSVYVYLSNVEEISFQKAAMAGGLSSNTEDYFPLEQAVMVEWMTDV